jgi:hypothetical protein
MKKRVRPRQGGTALIHTLGGHVCGVLKLLGGLLPLRSNQIISGWRRVGKNQRGRNLARLPLRLPHQGQQLGAQDRQLAGMGRPLQFRGDQVGQLDDRAHLVRHH